MALSSMHPLAVSDVVLMRTAFALQAVDFETGKLVWKYNTGGESLEAFLRALGSRQTGQSTQQLLNGLNERMWQDTTYGTLSCDGEQVYYIEDLALGGLTSNVGAWPTPFLLRVEYEFPVPALPERTTGPCLQGVSRFVWTMPYPLKRSPVAASGS